MTLDVTHCRRPYCLKKKDVFASLACNMICVETKRRLKWNVLILNCLILAVLYHKVTTWPPAAHSSITCSCCECQQLQQFSICYRVLCFHSQNKCWMLRDSPTWEQRNKSLIIHPRKHTRACTNVHTLAHTVAYRRGLMIIKTCFDASFTVFQGKLGN